MKCRNEEEEEEEGGGGGRRELVMIRSMAQTLAGGAFGLAHRCTRADDVDAFGVCLCCPWPPYHKPNHTTGLITQSNTNMEGEGSKN